MEGMYCTQNRPSGHLLAYFLFSNIWTFLVLNNSVQCTLPPIPQTSWQCTVHTFFPQCKLSLYSVQYTLPSVAQTSTHSVQQSLHPPFSHTLPHPPFSHIFTQLTWKSVGKPIKLLSIFRLGLGYEGERKRGGSSQQEQRHLTILTMWTHTLCSNTGSHTWRRVQYH